MLSRVTRERYLAPCTWNENQRKYITSSKEYGVSLYLIDPYSFTDNQKKNKKKCGKYVMKDTGFLSKMNVQEVIIFLFEIRRLKFYYGQQRDLHLVFA